MDNVQRGIDYNYRLGYPELRSSAFRVIEEEGPILEINTDIIKGRLVYSRKGDFLSAELAVGIQITDLSGEQNIDTERITAKLATRTNSVRTVERLRVFSTTCS